MAIYSLQDITRIVGVTRQTIYNWLRAGIIQQPERNYRGGRMFNDRNLKDLLNYKNRHRTAREDRK